MAPSVSPSTAPSSASNSLSDSRLVATHRGAGPPKGTPTAGPSRGLPAGDHKNADGKFIGRRAKKPKILAVITEACTGCAGAPVCQPYCPVDECMLLVPAEDAFPYARIWVDPLRCVGCKKCVSRGPEETFLDGCPWDAIRMVPTAEWEAEHGDLPY